MKDNSLGLIEVAILDLIQTYCECSVDNATFHNSATSCSDATVTFSSNLAYASNDGSVTATVLMETFEAGVSKDNYPTITLNGKELNVSLPADVDDNSSCTANLIMVVIVSAMLVSVVACIIIIIICG